MNSSLVHIIYKLSLWLHGCIFLVIQDTTGQKDKTKEHRNIPEKSDSNVVLD